MPVSFLIRHWKKELQVFQENFSKLLKTSDTDAIHDLRVAVKKLRSYYKFYSIIFDKNNPSLFQQTENLFAVLGKQRNVEICLELLSQLKYAEKLPGLHRHFNIFLSETELRSKLALQSYSMDELQALTLEIEQDILNPPEEIIMEEARGTIKTSIDESHHLLHNFDENFHLVRKKLKDVFYWSKMLPVQFYFSTSQVEKLDDSLDLLGKIQDHEILRSNSRYFRRNFLVKGDKEFELIKELENFLKEDKKSMLEKVHKLLKNLLVKN
jgi:CHAD domain-containing protein